MKHLESASKLKLISPKHSHRSKKYSLLSIFTVATIFIMTLGYGLTHFITPINSDKIAPIVKQDLIEKFTKLKSVKVHAVKLNELESALESMKLSPVERESLRKTLGTDYQTPENEMKVQVNQTVLAWLSVWDFASQDGDIVNISSAGYELNVPLLNNITRIAIPVDATSTAKVTGTTDGGGGITLGVMSEASPISFPVITVGQSLFIPLSF